MKKILSLLSLATLTLGLLGSCSKINERIDSLEKRVDGIENEQIASISSQIASISSSIADLGQIRSDITSLKQSAENHSQEIFDLMDADEILENRILTLQNFLDDVLPTFAETEWVKATFSTLAQYEATCDTIAKIDARIGALDTKLSKDIQTCADSLTKWVNKTFEGYYTAAQMDAKLGQMKSDIDSARAAGKITDAKADSLAGELAKVKPEVDTAKANIRAEYKAAVKSAIETSEGKLTKALNDAIATVNGKITSLTGRVDALETSVATLTGRVDKLEKMIQSVTIVPAYSDGSVEAINGLLELNLIVSPSSAAKGLTKEKVKILLKTVATKAAGVDTVKVDKITYFTFDDTKGTVEIKADISDKLNALQPKQLLTIAVNVTNGDLSDITTEFVTVDNTSGYKVTFNHNYGTSPFTRDTSVLKGGKINKPSDPVREGYFFDKWFTKKATGEKDVDWDFETMTVSQDTTLYAEWIQGLKVKFRMDISNPGVFKDTLVRRDTKVTKPTDPDSTGYTLLGWYTKKADGTFGGEWNFNTNVTKDTTLYAKWAKTSMTIAELVATNSKFPVSNSDDAPENVWLTANNDSCYFVTGVYIRFINRTRASAPVTYPSTTSLTRQGDGSYQNEQGTLKFVMDCDSVVSITLNRTGYSTELNGTYAPKSSILGFQLWEGGPIFAECNVGATKPEEAGYYFWWGDTVGYRHDGEKWVSADGKGTTIEFSSDKSPANTLFRKEGAALADYLDAYGNLKSDYDAATAHLGAPWRMMTEAEVGVLVTCPRTAINTQGEEFKNNGDTFAGWRIKGKEDYSSNSIFLPATGFGNGSDFDSSLSRYLTATPSSTNYENVTGIVLNTSIIQKSSCKRYNGLAVRAVRDAE